MSAQRRRSAPAVRCALGVLALLAACHRRAPGATVTPVGPRVVRCGDEGCPPDERAPIDGGSLRVHVEAEPGGLCDLVNHEAWVRWIVENQVMETLVEQSPQTGAFTGRLAERWERRPGQLIFHLRDGVRFHDGQPFTAADVVFTLERARDPKLAADQKSDLDGVTRIEAPDARTVVLGVPGPAPFLLQALAHMVIYPKHLLDGVTLRGAHFCRAPVGTGPFRAGAWDSGVSLLLQRNDDYWGTRPHLARIEFKFVRDREVAYRLYRRGELDVLWRLPADAGRAAAHDATLAGHRLYLHTPHVCFFIVWNTRRPELAPPAARVALSQLVDWPRFVQVAFDGDARAQSGPFVLGTPSYDASIQPWAYDPKAAASALAQLAAPPRRLRFLSTSGAPAVEELATLLEEDLRKAGIELTIEKLDFARVLERLRAHDFDAAALQLTLSIEQDNYGIFHSRAVDEQNWAGFSDAAVDALLEKIRRTDDPGARHALDRELHRALHERGPMTFLVAPEVYTAVAPGVGGVRPSSDGLDLEHAFRTSAP